MLRNKIIKSLLVLLLITLSKLSYSQTIGPWNLENLYKVPNWEVTTLAPKDGVTSILFRSIDYLGNPVQVFAYYSAPTTGVMPAGGWPAMVHAHGGGGTAYSEWVKYFNDQGYAAISLDLEGHIPTEDVNGAYLPSPNPGPSRSGVFNDYEKPIEEQWFYHAISQVILAHTLIASFPEVNATKIGLSGASWGGTITSTAMGVDNRWSWAVPVYGAGYLDDSDGAQGNAISDAKADFVNQYYDASVYFDRVDFPTLFINGTNDYNFAMPVTQNSAKHVNGNIRYSLEFGHSNLAPLRLDEIFSFANQVSYGTAALPTFEPPFYSIENIASVNVTSEAGLSSGELLYTLDDGYWYERKWLALPATIKGNVLTATLPENTTTFYFTATDSRGLMTTSEYLEINDTTIPSGNPNIAVYGTATQSSTASGAEASRANDSNTNGAFSEESVTRTASEVNPWWEVNLGSAKSIGDIIVYNRTDECCKGRLKQFTVTVMDANRNTLFTQSFTSYPDPSITINAGDVIGQIIQVRLDNTNQLTLAEVEVYEGEYPVSNLALNGTASQSSTANSGAASRAIDGNTNGEWNSNSVSHTSDENNAWWMVTLDDNYSINEIKVYNHINEPYMDRLSNFTVQVLTSNGAIVFSQIITSTPYPLVSIDVGGIEGNRVRILQNNASTALSLAEIEVYGENSASLSTKSLLNWGSEGDNEMFVINSNPVKELTTIQLKTFETAEYQIFNSNGQIILSGMLYNGLNTIDFSDFSSGIYLIKVLSGLISKTKKIIKN